MWRRWMLAVLALTLSTPAVAGKTKLFSVMCREALSAQARGKNTNRAATFYLQDLLVDFGRRNGLTRGATHYEDYDLRVDLARTRGSSVRKALSHLETLRVDTTRMDPNIRVVSGVVEGKDAIAKLLPEIEALAAQAESASMRYALGPNLIVDDRGGYFCLGAIGAAMLGFGIYCGVAPGGDPLAALAFSGTGIYALNGLRGWASAMTLRDPSFSRFKGEVLSWLGADPAKRSRNPFFGYSRGRVVRTEVDAAILGNPTDDELIAAHLLDMRYSEAKNDRDRFWAVQGYYGHEDQQAEFVKRFPGQKGERFAILDQAFFMGDEGEPVWVFAYRSFGEKPTGTPRPRQPRQIQLPSWSPQGTPGLVPIPVRN